MEKFYKIRNISDVEGEITVYGEITKYPIEEWREVGAVTFKEELQKLKDKKRVHLKINSSGGDVFEAIAMYHELKRLGEKTEIISYIDGIAASAATLLVLAGKKRVMGEGCFFMIHNPLLYMGYADKDEITKGLELLEKTKENILDIYEKNSTLTREELSEKMDKTSWLSTKEAFQMGFINEIANYDKSIINKNIKSIKNISNFSKLGNFIPEELENIINKEEKMTLQELKNQYPELLKNYENEILEGLQKKMY